MKRLNEYNYDSESENDQSTDLQNGGPTESSNEEDTSQSRSGSVDRDQMPELPLRMPPRWDDNQMRRYIQETLTRELEEREKKKVVEKQLEKEKFEANRNFKGLKEKKLTKEKMDTFFVNVRAHLDTYNVSDEREKLRFLGSKLEGRMLQTFNKGMRDGLSFNLIVDQIKEDRFGPENKWERMQEITFDGSGSAVEYWTRKLEAIYACDCNASKESIIEQMIAGMKKWREYDEMRKSSYRMYSKDKVEELKRYFIQIANLKPAEKEENKEVMVIDQKEKLCYLCKKPGHLKRECLERRAPPMKKAKVSCFKCQGDHYSNDCPKKLREELEREREEKNQLKEQLRTGRYKNHHDRYQRNDQRDSRRQSYRNDQDRDRYDGVRGKDEIPFCENNKIGELLKKKSQLKSPNQSEMEGDGNLNDTRAESKIGDLNLTFCVKENKSEVLPSFLSYEFPPSRTGDRAEDNDKDFLIEELKIEDEKRKAERKFKIEKEAVVVNSIKTGMNENNTSRFDLLKVGAKANSHVCEILLDSGAKVNCISQNFASKIGAKVKGCSSNLVGANKSTLKVVGKTKLKIEFEGEMTSFEINEVMEVEGEEENTQPWRRFKNKQRQKLFQKAKNNFEIEFIIVKELTVPVLIGFLSIQEMEVSINTRRGTVSFGRKPKKIRLSYVGEKENYVHCIDDIIIEPFKMGQVIKVKVDDEVEENTLYTIEEIMRLPGVLIEEGVVDGDTQQLLISNFSKEKLRLEKAYQLEP